LVGETFGSYRIEEKLGEGGMGVVYRAVDTELDRPVAIKTLLSTPTSIPEDDRLPRFLREAKAASRLQHPAIVTIHQYGVQGDTRFIVMEYVEGKTLKKIVGGHPLHINQVCEIAIQVADGLALAHEKGIIHRDLKSENVMVTPRGQVKILDFGLAKLKEPETHDTEAATAAQSLTQAGMIMGTITNMSPEQALGSDIDTRSDIFSYGVVLYEMLTGKMPFEAPSPQATLARILNAEPAPPTQINQECPVEMERLVQQCLSKNRNLRPSGGEIVARLKNIQASLSASQISATQIRSGPVPVMQPSGASPIVRPGSGSIPALAVPKSGAVAAPGSGMQPAVALSVSQAKRVLLVCETARKIVTIASLAVPLAFFAYMVIGAGVIRTEMVQGTRFMAVLTAIVGPVLSLAEKVFTFRMVVGGWNLMLALLGAAAFVVRHVILIPFDKLSAWAKTRVVRARASGTRTLEASSAERVSGQRLALLREYAEAKKILSQEKRNLAFLSIDVVGSTKMKAGEEKLVIEHAFSEYKKFVEQILKVNNAWKAAWTPDGVMIAFFTPAEAVKAGREVLARLGWFNDGVHHMRTPFSVRCGVNAGEVVFPESKGMEEISDEVIDVAGHMQKYAAPDSLWLSREVLNQLADRGGFRPVTDKQVDGRTAYEWRVGGDPAAGATIIAPAQ
jgi:serine/threonine protein kinase/class 3 adenylate cyclase